MGSSYSRKCSDCCCDCDNSRSTARSRGRKRSHSRSRKRSSKSSPDPDSKKRRECHIYVHHDCCKTQSSTKVSEVKGNSRSRARTTSKTPKSGPRKKRARRSSSGRSDSTSSATSVDSTSSTQPTARKIKSRSRNCPTSKSVDPESKPISPKRPATRRKPAKRKPRSEARSRNVKFENDETCCCSHPCPGTIDAETLRRTTYDAVKASLARLRNRAKNGLAELKKSTANSTSYEVNEVSESEPFLGFTNLFRRHPFEEKSTTRKSASNTEVSLESIPLQRHSDSLSPLRSCLTRRARSTSAKARRRKRCGAEALR